MVEGAEKLNEERMRLAPPFHLYPDFKGGPRAVTVERSGRPGAAADPYCQRDLLGRKSLSLSILGDRGEAHCGGSDSMAPMALFRGSLFATVAEARASLAVGYLDVQAAFVDGAGNLKSRCRDRRPASA